MTRQNRFSILLIAAALLLTLITRIRSYNEPLDRDIAGYAVIGHEILSGRSLYSEIWDQKPPAIHWTYAIASAVAGFGPLSVLLLNLSSQGTILLLLFLIGKRVHNGEEGAWLALFWSLTSFDLGIFGNQPNTEVFINCCLLALFALVLDRTVLDFRRALLMGFAIAVASLYKQVALAPAFAIMTVYAVAQWRRNGKAIVRPLLCAVLVPVIVWGLVTAYFWLSGRLRAFAETMIVANMQYAQWDKLSQQTFSLLAVGSIKLFFSMLFQLKGSFPVLFLACAVLLVGVLVRYSQRRYEGLLIGAGAVGSCIAIVMPHFFSPHYFQLLSPWIIVGLGWSALVVADGHRARQIVRRTVLLGVATCLFIVQAPSLALSADEISRSKFGSQFIDTRDLSSELNGMLAPSETFFNYGDDTGLYFYTRKRPPVAFLGGRFFLLNEGWPFVSNFVLRGLAESKPDLIVISKFAEQGRVMATAVGRWIKANYEPLPGKPDRGRFYLIVRKDSPLEKRLLRTKGTN